MTIVFDVISNLRALNLPRISKVEPVVGLLVLEPILDGLPKHAVLVADAVSPCRQVESGHRVKKASSQAAETAVSQRSIALLLHDGLQIVAHLMHGLRELVLDFQVVKSVVHGAPHQKLHGHVVHTLRILLLEILLGVVPRLDQTVAQAVGAGLVGLKVVKLVARARQGVLHMIHNAFLNAEHIVADIGVHECVKQVLLGVGGDCGEIGSGADGLVAGGGAEDGGEAVFDVVNVFRVGDLGAAGVGDVKHVLHVAGAGVVVHDGLGDI
mmetsp:Transcript_30409/g.54460  ORF Transcript_30409/g.54460 Transcript_30409/m.54460 type:complete len:268 (-) Transcript_30409:180-983(-)